METKSSRSGTGQVPTQSSPPLYSAAVDNLTSPSLASPWSLARYTPSPSHLPAKGSTPPGVSAHLQACSLAFLYSATYVSRLSARVFVHYDTASWAKVTLPSAIPF